MLTFKSPDIYVNEPGALQRLGTLTRQYGHNAYVIGGETALKQVSTVLEASLEAEGIKVIIEVNTGEVTLDNIENYAVKLSAAPPDFIVGVGGGRVLDLVKAIGDRLDIPVVTVPTIAATCAAWSALTILHDDEGRVDGALFLKASPRVVVADTAVLAEAPSFFNALDMFRHVGAQTVGLPMDEQGLDVRQVEELLRSTVATGGVLPKLIYVIPNFQNPTGTTLPAERRKRLAALAQTYNLYILEDDAYGELRYEGHDLPSIYSFAPERVIYVSTFSKTLGPGLRLGTVIAPLKVAERMRVLTINSPPTPFTLEIVGHLLQTYDYDAQISRLTACYRARRDFMAECVKAEFGEAVTFHLPEGGFFLWLSFKEGIDALEIVRLAREQGVLVVPGEQFFTDNQAPNPFLRLCFSYCNEREIARGVQALAAAYRLLGQMQKGHS